MVSGELIATSFVAGGYAGIITDSSLYPIDTIKTRLQSKRGFVKSGGFRGVYRGLGAALFGTLPSNTSFFIAYNVTKHTLPTYIQREGLVFLCAGVVGEIASITARIPFEVVKQTAQGSTTFTSRQALKHIIRTSGVRGLYSGYFSTIYRDVPFTGLQMPMWEFLKKLLQRYNNNTEVTPLQSGVCGSVASAIAAALTMPLDVAKTRIILSNSSDVSHTENPFRIIWRIFRNEGVSRLFSGISPRIAMMTVGGFLYLGAYDFARLKCDVYFASANFPAVEPLDTAATLFMRNEDVCASCAQVCVCVHK